MKRIKLFALLFAFTAVSGSLLANDCCRTECSVENSCDCENVSRSYLASRPMDQSADPIRVSGFRSDRLHAKEGGWRGATEVALFGSKSTNDRDLARYFFPFCKTSLIVEEFEENTGMGTDNSPVLPTSSKPIDMLANHFNIFTVNNNFKSEISIRPSQSVIGAGFQIKESFGRNDDETRGFFTSFAFPIQRVSNNLNFKETVLNDGGGVSSTADNGTVVANMTEAFSQTGWDFGKIKTRSMSKTGVADIEFKVGYEWIQEDPFHLESYLGILIPTGNKPNSQFLFEPIVGHGRHWGIMLGNSLGIQIWEDQAKDRQFRMEYASHTQYLFRNTQCRSLDLKCKPWSRYIELYSNEEQATSASTFNAPLSSQFATAGINVLTMPLKVRPGFQHNMTTAATFRSKGWRVEGGYNLFCRQSECVKLACPWQQGPAIKYFTGSGLTNPVRDITGNARLELITNNTTNRIALADYKYNMIKESDLDLVSASSPTLITHTIYAAGGYTFECDYPTFFTVGGSYEFNKSNNAGVERWALWGKLGLSF
jgi:hypothetical protein